MLIISVIIIVIVIKVKFEWWREKFKTLSVLLDINYLDEANFDEAGIFYYCLSKVRKYRKLVFMYTYLFISVREIFICFAECHLNNNNSKRNNYLCMYALHTYIVLLNVTFTSERKGSLLNSITKAILRVLLHFTKCAQVCVKILSKPVVESWKEKTMLLNPKVKEVKLMHWIHFFSERSRRKGKGVVK